MKRRLTVLTTAIFCVALATPDAHGQASAARPARATPAPVYFPERLNWQRKAPADLGMNAALVAEAVQAAAANESTAPRDLMAAHAISYGREPFDSPIGPVGSRGPASGLIVHKGYIVAEWGEPKRVDMTFSVTKTFLTTVVGLAWQRGLIRDLNDYARDYMPAGAKTLEDGALFEAEHNRKITWDHLLRQTSDWQGTLWSKPDWADRPVGQPAEWMNRPLHEPGTFFKYNDVRVNVLALAALHVWRRPLPEVLRDEVMEPIGASSGWRWYGYDNSWIELDGRHVQSVTGGGHWGGGMYIDAYDMARFGYLFLRNGKWRDRQIISTEWIEKARTPGRANANYGFANWYLNNPVADRKPLPSAPATAVRFVGNGNNIVYMDWDNDIVMVARWVNNDQGLDAIVGKALASLGSLGSGRK
jgi:CubicO group peptidase (beta-lactamase class C family)